MNEQINLDPSFLIGRQIGVLSFHRWGGHLVLNERDPEIEIGFEADLRFISPGGMTTAITDMRDNGGLLSSLLGLRIVGTDWQRTTGY